MPVAALRGTQQPKSRLILSDQLIVSTIHGLLTVTSASKTPGVRVWGRRRQRGGWTISTIHSGPAAPEPTRAWNDPTWTPPFDDDPDPVTSIKLMPEYGVELPLWGADWWQLGLATDLLNDLADWQEQFDTGFSCETGWKTSDVAVGWARRGADLATELRKQLPPSIELGVDLWPVAPPRQRRWFERWRR
jgi:hypothetical protein